jgi:hypothetical protein
MIPPALFVSLENMQVLHLSNASPALRVPTVQLGQVLVKYAKSGFIMMSLKLRPVPHVHLQARQVFKDRLILAAVQYALLVTSVSMAVVRIAQRADSLCKIQVIVEAVHWGSSLIETVHHA